MERELHCPVCKDFFTDPVRLQCTHHICSGCVKTLANGRTLACPVCSHLTVLPADGALSVDKALQLVTEAWREKLEVPQQNGDGSAAGEPQPCGFCEERTATRHCLQCDGVYCEACEKSVHAKAMFKGHTIVDLGDTAARAFPLASCIGRRMKCDVHDGEKLNFFCLTCKEQVCSHCLILGSHKNHESSRLDQACEHGKQSLGGHVEVVEQRLATLEDLLGKLHESELDVQNNAESQRDIINSELDALKEKIEAKRNQLLSKSQLEEQQKRTQLHTQFDRAEGLRKDSEDLLARSSEVLAVGSEHAFLAVVLPLIQDMKKSEGHAIDRAPMVSCGFRPLCVEAQKRAILDLDLGSARPHPQSSPPPGVTTSYTQQQHGYTVVQQGYNAAAHATAAQVSYLPQVPPQQLQPQLPLQQQAQQHMPATPVVRTPSSVVYNSVR